jgi:hypothetical protein
MSKPDIYTEVVRITHSYLGPAADRFITRQVHNHLHKSPEELTQKDLLKLIDWIRIGVSMLTDSSEIVEEYIRQLQKLATEKKTARKGKGRHGKN